MEGNKESKRALLISIMLLAQISLLSTGCSSTQNITRAEETKITTEIIGDTNEYSPNKTILNKLENIIKTRYNPPLGYKRVALEGKSFGLFLREQGLRDYDESHSASGVYDSVLDIKIDPENMHQSSAMMLMRAEYLYTNGHYDQIEFSFESGFLAEYEKWVQGYRLDKQGGVTQWVQRGNNSNKPEDLRDFMEAVFKYSGGLSIDKKLEPVDINQMSIGDMFVRGGGVGQIVMIIDMAESEDTGEKIFMLAQSSIETKETSILLNPRDPDISPWYSQDIAEGLVTPMGKFVQSDLKSFK